MRSGARTRDDAGMSAVELQLSLSSTDPLAGRVIAPDGRAVAFEGWAGLAGALQTALAPAAPGQLSNAAASAARPGTSSLP